MESSFYERTARKQALAAVVERSLMVEQLVYIQYVDGSIPSVPIRCIPTHLHDKTLIIQQEGIWQQSGVFLCAKKEGEPDGKRKI